MLEWMSALMNEHTKWMHGQINELSQGFVAFLGDFCDKKMQPTDWPTDGWTDKPSYRDAKKEMLESLGYQYQTSQTNNKKSSWKFKKYKLENQDTAQVEC